MSDDESFVILGTSPLSSLESDGATSSLDSKNSANNSLIQSTSTSSGFTSLKSSQLIDLKNAQDVPTQTPSHHHDIQTEMADPIVISMKSQKFNSMIKSVETDHEQQEAIAASKLWSTPPQAQEDETTISYSLKDCALKSPLAQKQNSKDDAKKKIVTSISQENLEENDKSTSYNHSPSSAENLASNFIMGEVTSDVLMTSVYSQFPSISMEAGAEDVVKLQNLVTEYSQLKTTIKKANNTMKQFYSYSLQWKEKMSTMEEQYKQQLDNCKKEVEELRKQNKEIENNFKMQIEALEIARKKDREENIKELSEKTSLLVNMRAQIIKLEQQQQLTPSKVVEQNKVDQMNKGLLKSQENEILIKDLQRQLSEMLASNLDLKDIEKQYIDELNCLKVNLTAAEELMKKNHVEIAELRLINVDGHEHMLELEESLQSLQLTCDEQKERIILLEAQNELFRKDFEMEKQSREAAVKEKQQNLLDLRALQKRNQELIEEHQKMAIAYRKRVETSPPNDSQITAAAAVAETYFNNPQRPIRVSDVLPSPSTFAVQPPAANPVCPICNKAFKTLSVLLGHVNGCVDRS